MKQNTIKDAIVQILSHTARGLTPKEIYIEITEKKLFDFTAKSPVSIVNSELRKSCLGLQLKKSRPEKLFMQLKDGTFSLISNKIPQ